MTNWDIFFNDKTKKAKDITIAVSENLLANPNNIDALITFAATTKKDAVKGSCIEGIEYATKINPTIATKKVFSFVIQSLSYKAPRVQWESAKVIGNTAHLFPIMLEEATVHLLTNTKNTGTVVRWSAAYALGEIIKLNTPLNATLIPAIEQICANEEKSSIQKIYTTALKKVKS